MPETPWMKLIKALQKKHPEKRLKEIMFMAKKIYSK